MVVAALVHQGKTDRDRLGGVERDFVDNREHGVTGLGGVQLELGLIVYNKIQINITTTKRGRKHTKDKVSKYPPCPFAVMVASELEFDGSVMLVGPRRCKKRGGNVSSIEYLGLREKRDEAKMSTDCVWFP
ncbi:hypothetical protein BJ322DRAFT_1021759 [Thelephora terrestris]|uniref:Uncharacterized protein n=1 Tax=Thelephora terrestris TaxID=56493 RepID=A0A9P6HCC4_9AGAM|nr:hypothetical protein BJ322DRAFT_1021759 [Thelephora terrestris]